MTQPLGLSVKPGWQVGAGRLPPLLLPPLLLLPLLLLLPPLLLLLLLVDGLDCRAPPEKQPLPPVLTVPH